MTCKNCPFLHIHIIHIIIIHIIHMIFLFRRATAKLRGNPALKPTYLGVLNGALAMSVTY